MGEAKRRAAQDPKFGIRPKRGRGLIISSPIEIEGSTVRAGGSVDPQELRLALLFWDRLVWPSSNLIFVQSGPDETYLEQAGILTRPHYKTYGDFAEGLTKTQIQAFRDLEQKEPGTWSLAQGKNSLLVKDRALEEGRGLLIELHRAIPVPDKDVPLNEILEFKNKRQDELLRLRSEIDELFTKIKTAPDKDFELQRRIQEIDTACSDLLKVGKEWKYPVRLSDLKSSFDLNPHGALLAGYGAWEWAKTYQMPAATGTVIAALAGAAASVKITKDFGMSNLKLRSSPYRYVYQFHQELF